MVKTKFILALMLILQIRILPQTDSSYYPMTIGNFWEYWGSDYGKLVKKYTVITGDTLMSNGKKYFIFYNNYQIGYGNVEYWEYLRPQQDSLIYKFKSKCGTDEEEVLYNFSSKDSSYWPTCDTSNRIEKYFYGLQRTYNDYYFNFSSPIVSKVFTNVVITKVNGIEQIIWNPIRGIGSIVVAKGIGEVSALAELSPFWRIRGAIVNGNKYGTITTDIKDIHSEQLAPANFSINSFPNPFNISCNIYVQIPQDDNLSICVYNTLGQNIKLLYEGKINKGKCNFEFNASGLSSGIYVIVAKINSQIISSKALFLK